MEAQEYLSNNGVPKERRFAFISNNFCTKLRQSSSINTNSDQKTKLPGVVGLVDNVPVINFPNTLLPNNQQFILFHPDAAACGIKFIEIKIDDNSMYFREYHVVSSYLFDAFVLNKTFIYSCVSENKESG